MRSIKVEVVRTITSTTTYVIKMSESSAAKFIATAPTLTKDEIAEKAEDMYQISQRKIETMPFSSRVEIDDKEVINFARYKDCTGDN